MRTTIDLCDTGCTSSVKRPRSATPPGRCGAFAFPARHVGAGRYDPGASSTRHWGETMRRTTLVIACLLLAGAAVGCSSEPSYEEVTKQCAAALKAQYEADGEGRPGECEGVKDDDYTALVAAAAMGDLGWTGEDGEFDEGEMLDSLDETP